MRQFIFRQFIFRAFLALALTGTLSGCSSLGFGGGDSAPVTGAGQGQFKVGKPYQINGVWYTPREDYAYDETGIASWYGPGFHAELTANGEIFDQHELTAAHPTLPMPSLVRVTNLENGKQVVLRINDRGPFANNRILDVSRRGAELLGFKQQGTAKVRVQILGEESRAIADAARRSGKNVKLASGNNLGNNMGNNLPAPAALPRTPVQTQALPAPTIIEGGAAPAKAVDVQPLPPPPSSPSVSPALASIGTYQGQRFLPSAKVTQTAPPAHADLYVQAGAFSNYDNAERLSQDLAKIGKTEVSQAVVNGRTFYRVRLGPLRDVAQADNVLARVTKAGQSQARIIVD